MVVLDGSCTALDECSSLPENSPAIMVLWLSGEYLILVVLVILMLCEMLPALCT